MALDKSGSKDQAASNLIDAIHASNLLLVVGADGTVQEANQRLLKRLGSTARAIVGAPTENLISAADGLRTGLMSLRAKGGEMIEVFATVYQQGSGDTATTTVVAQELTADAFRSRTGRSKAEASILERMLSVDYDSNGTITHVNPQTLSLLGYTLQELRGQTEEVLVSSTVFEGESRQELWRNLRAGKAEDRLCHFFGKDGNDVFIQAHYEPILDADGGLAQILLRGCDVSGSEKRLRKAFEMMERKSDALKEALHEAREAQRLQEEMDRALQAMATPVTPIWDEVLLLPLVGVVDSTRTDDAMKTTLDKISATGAKMFILDISGVPSVDTAVANQLIKITKATKIMGCETIVSGVSSAIAHTIVELGIDIGEMLTTSSLRDAVSISLDRVRHSRKENKKSKKAGKKSKLHK